MTAAESEEMATAYGRAGTGSAIQCLLRYTDTKETATEVRVRVVMRLLEVLAEHQVEPASCLMLSLWPFASELMMHDVCDSIDLWISHNPSPVVKDCLKNAAASEVDPNLKRHIQGLL